MRLRVLPESLPGRIQALVPDPRRRRGRMDPPVALPGMLLLGAPEGEGSLRGMGRRGRTSGPARIEALGLEDLPDPPERSTVWDGLQRGEAERLAEALGIQAVGGEEARCGDRKYGRGSRRREPPALPVRVGTGQKGGPVWRPPAVRGDESSTAGALFAKIPPEGKG